MAPSSSLVFLRRCLLAALLCVAAPCGMSDRGPEDIVGRAMACFNDRAVYIRCQESYRLSAQGFLNVPFEATDAYCGGPCLSETSLVLNCINGILDNFRFYNGASIRDVRYALRRGCGHGTRRGYFNALDRTEGGGYGYEGGLLGDYDGDYYYDSGNTLAVSLTVLLMLIVSCVLLLWAF